MFNPLAMLRELRDDDQLTSTEMLVFVPCAGPFAHRQHHLGRVRASGGAG